MLARCSTPQQLVKAWRIPARALAGAVKVHACDVDAYDGPAGVERTEPKLEMGVLYAPGVPSPSEGVNSIEPIVVDGLVATTGGDVGGSPLHTIKLCAWYARPHAAPHRTPPHPRRHHPPRNAHAQRAPTGTRRLRRASTPACAS